MCKALIVNADDLGLSSEINEGIFTALKKGVISDMSLMVSAPRTEEAIQKLDEAGVRGLGLHINLDEPFGWDMPGKERHSREELFELLSDREFLQILRSIARAQIERFLDLGLTPTHIDTHHHIHGFFPVFTILVELAREYGIPAMRHSTSGYTLTTRKPVPFHEATYVRMKETLDREGIFTCRAMVEGADTVSTITQFPAELVVHPSIIGDAWRSRELDLLCSDDFRRFLEEAGISLASFHDLSGFKGQRKNAS